MLVKSIKVVGLAPGTNKGALSTKLRLEESHLFRGQEEVKNFFMISKHPHFPSQHLPSAIL